MSHSAGMLCSLNTWGRPAAWDGGQTSGLCHVAVCPPAQPQSHHTGAGRRHQRCSRASAQSSASLAASDCKYLREAGRPRCYWQLLTGSSVQKEEKNTSQVGARVWVLGKCTSGHTSRSSPFSGLKHILHTGQFIMLQTNLGGLDAASRTHPNSAVWMKG